VKQILGRRAPSPAGKPQIRCAAGVLLLLCVPSLAAAQNPAPQDPLAPGAVRPPVLRRPAPERLTFGLFLIEGVDFVDATDGRPGLIVDSRIRQNVSFSAFNASLNYSQLGEQKSYTLATGASLRYYSVQPEVIPSNIYGGASISTKLGQRANFRGSANFGYSPFYSFGSFLMPSSSSYVRIPNDDQNIARLDNNTAGGSASLSWKLTSRSSLYTGYTLDSVSTTQDAYRVFTQGINGGYQRQMTRYTNLRLGYGVRRSIQGLESAPHFDTHTIDTGIGYGRPISSSRRTTVSFGTGLVLINEAGLRSFNVTGDASLMYQLQRTWTTGVSYSRNVGKVGALLTPFVTDTLSGYLSGLWTRKFGFSASGGLSLGNSALVVTNSYSGVYGNGRFHYELSRHVPIFVEYVYYQYGFEQSRALAPGFPMSMRRNGIRFGLGYSTPLIGPRF